MVKVSPATIIRVIKAGSAEVIDTAKVPAKPVKPVVWQYAAIGAMLGLMLSVALIFLRDFFDNTFAMVLVGTIGLATIAGLAVFLIRQAG